MIGSHTDSPCLRVKPISNRTADGFLQIGVETYGGGLWHTCFDRDLSLAGRVMLRAQNARTSQKLVRLDKPICKIPPLAPHFHASVPFEFNKETQLVPLAGMVAAQLDESPVATAEDASTTSSISSPLSPMQRHHPKLVQLIADQLVCEPLISSVSR